jgi:hypothetical protein
VKHMYELLRRLDILALLAGSLAEYLANL